MEQTQPVNDNDDFRSLETYIGSILQEKGYQRIQHKGSSSWIDPRIKPVDAIVKFKLCFFGPDDLRFGVRREFVEENNDMTQDVINCPDIFTVSPSNVEFVGFKVQNNQAGESRLSDLLDQFN